MASENIVPVAGAFATFAGYHALEDGMEEILTKGQRVLILSDDGDQGLAVVAIDAEGQRLNEEGGVWENGQNYMGDRVFPAELTDVQLPNTETEAGEQATDAADAAAPAEEAPAETPVSELKGKALEQAYSDLPGEIDGWGNMKADEKRAALAKALSGDEDEEQAEPVAEEAAADAPAGLEVNTEAEDPTPETAAAAAASDAETASTMPAMVPGADLVQTVSDSQSVRELLAEKDAVSAAKYLLVQEQRTQYTLGGVLKNINETGAYKSLGYTGKNGFVEFCEQELGVKYRKARYLINIYTTFQQIGVDEEALERIGWSKAAELARIPVDRLQSDIDALLDRASGGTRDDLIKHIKENYEVATQAEKAKTTTFSFKTVEADAETVRTAMDHAKLLVDDGDVNKAFVHMCGDWMNQAEGTDMDLDSFMALGLARFGREAIEAKLAEGESGSSDTSELEAAISGSN